MSRSDGKRGFFLSEVVSVLNVFIFIALACPSNEIDILSGSLSTDVTKSLLLFILDGLGCYKAFNKLFYGPNIDYIADYCVVVLIGFGYYWALIMGI